MVHVKGHNFDMFNLNISKLRPLKCTIQIQAYTLVANFHFDVPFNDVMKL